MSNWKKYNTPFCWAYLSLPHTLTHRILGVYLKNAFRMSHYTLGKAIHILNILISKSQPCALLLIRSLHTIHEPYTVNYMYQSQTENS